jgi:murein DD-endopeptidase MepM/ murein hydrolase activator NlpD
VTASASLVAPIIRARERVTKKQYGTQVSPSRSPVSPERFTGFHTGVDFEIFPGEENADVPVAAACDGTVLLARYVGGYGGVLVQSCTVAGQAVTVLYGHLRLASITAKVGDGLRSGDRIAVLGTGYSAETDQERRHLHLAVHRGSGVELRGYVSTQAQLAGWIDPLTLLP